MVEHQVGHHARSRAWSTERGWICSEAGGCGHDRAAESVTREEGWRCRPPLALTLVEGVILLLLLQTRYPSKVRIRVSWMASRGQPSWEGSSYCPLPPRI